jgi:hypothetical protein
MITAQLSDRSREEHAKGLGSYTFEVLPRIGDILTIRQEGETSWYEVINLTHIIFDQAKPPLIFIKPSTGHFGSCLPRRRRCGDVFRRGIAVRGRRGCRPAGRLTARRCAHSAGSLRRARSAFQPSASSVRVGSSLHSRPDRSGILDQEAPRSPEQEFPAAKRLQRAKAELKRLEAEAAERRELPRYPWFALGGAARSASHQQPIAPGLLDVVSHCSAQPDKMCHIRRHRGVNWHDTGLWVMHEAR